MRRRLFILASSLTVSLMVGGLVWAAQLNGIQIKPVGNKVEVLLDMPAGQPYEVKTLPDNSYNITLPNATLPRAFQVDGIPPLKSPETGATAIIQQTSQGLQIQIKGGKHPNSPYEVRFTSQVPQSNLPVPLSPMALLKPPKAEVDSLFSKLKHQLPAKSHVEAKAKTSQKIAAKPKPKRIATALVVHHATAKRPVPRKVAVKPHPYVVPKVASTSKLATVQPAPTTVTTPPQSALSQKQPIIVEEKSSEGKDQKSQIATTKTSEGYNYLEQAGNQNQQTASPEKAQPETVQPKASPAREMQQANPLTEPAPSHHRTLTDSIIQWIFVSIGLLGALILITVVLAIRVKRKMAQRVAVAEPEEAQPTEYFEEPVVQTPEPETFVEYLTAERVKPAPETQAPEKILSPQPKPALEVAQKPPRVSPQREIPKMAYPSNELLAKPADSIATAVKRGLAVRVNPYISAPFPLSRKAPNLQGGPKPKKRNNVVAPNNTNDFNQFLKRPS